MPASWPRCSGSKRARSPPTGSTRFAGLLSLFGSIVLLKGPDTLIAAPREGCARRGLRRAGTCDGRHGRRPHRRDRRIPCQGDGSAVRCGRGRGGPAPSRRSCGETRRSDRLGRRRGVAGRTRRLVQRVRTIWFSLTEPPGRHQSVRVLAARAAARRRGPRGRGSPPRVDGSGRPLREPVRTAAIWQDEPAPQGAGRGRGGGHGHRARRSVRRAQPRGHHDPLRARVRPPARSGPADGRGDPADHRPRALAGDARDRRHLPDRAAHESAPRDPRVARPTGAGGRAAGEPASSSRSTSSRTCSRWTISTASSAATFSITARWRPTSSAARSRA